ncbi:MAG: hypothetical protein JWQ71_3657 [Pedosphaera sp.]|nr:hypothetical protein [Pedosphaera sp.]
MHTSSTQTSSQQPTAAFAHQAAKASWVCAALVFCVTTFGKSIGPKVVIELIALLLMVIGFVLGIVALFGISRHGAKGILTPALTGILLNGLLIFIFATNFMAARAKAQGISSELKPGTSLASAGNMDTHDRKSHDQES